MSGTPKFLSQTQIKNEELSLLLEFDQFCRNNDLCYSLCGGTLLGAIRHKGFIPWDDDIDVMVPRKDFDKFVSLSQAGALDNSRAIEILPPNSSYPVYVKYISKEFSLREKFVAGTHHLWIDVFPIDGLPADDNLLRKKYKLATLYRRLILVSRADSHDGRSVAKKLVKRLLVPILLKINFGNFIAKKLDRLCRQDVYGETGYAGILGWGLYGPGERYPDTAFDHMPIVKFEGHEFPIISCWRQYLTGIYGDYMKLPPVDKRQTHELMVWKTSEGCLLNKEQEKK
jgi:lipopolysaccharide cholinephosphotransferase